MHAVPALDIDSLVFMSFAFLIFDMEFTNHYVHFLIAATQKEF